MTDSQLIQGIIDNNTIVWRYICRNLKSPFTATLKRLYDTGSLTAEDWEDIFQDSCIIMMERVKEGKFEQRPGSSLFSYFIEIGKNNVQNALRKQKKHQDREHGDPDEKAEEKTARRFFFGKIKIFWMKAANAKAEKKDRDPNEGCAEERDRARMMRQSPREE